jgi:hypothetical protein
LAGALQTYTIDARASDGSLIKVGFMGLAEEEWLGLLPEVPMDIIEYEDYVSCA